MRRTTIAALLATILALALALAAWYQLHRDAARPNVVLITIDTLRADRLGCYGSATTQTPNIDRLAREGIRFEHAASPLPETRPAHFTLLTSRYPRQHGVVSNALTLGDDALTLAEVYAEAGYDTAAFVGCILLDGSSGAQQGFQHFDAPETPQRPADQVVPAALRWLDEASAEAPFFLWLHLFDPHMPYEPPPPFNERSAPQQVAALPSFTWPRLLTLAAENDGDLPRPVLERALDLYDGEVEYVDHWLGQLFAALEARDQWDDTIVLLTADHGECFGNGIFFDHSYCLYDGAIAVPLLLRYPPRLPAGQRIAAQVEHIDVAPTLLALSGLPRPAPFAGRGLLARAERDDAPYAFLQHPFYRSFDVTTRRDVVRQLRAVAGEPTRPILGDRLQVGVRSSSYKYLLEGDEEQLFDLKRDPAERQNLAASEEERVRAMRREARIWMQRHPLELAEEGEVNPELIENLKALGYL